MCIGASSQRILLALKGSYIIIGINSDIRLRCLDKFINSILTAIVGLVRTVVSISHCGCDDPGSIPGLDSQIVIFCIFFFLSPHEANYLSQTILPVVDSYD